MSEYINAVEKLRRGVIEVRPTTKRHPLNPVMWPRRLSVSIAQQP
jgi:hypothetical protein